jgi:hypothetical protein
MDARSGRVISAFAFSAFSVLLFSKITSYPASVSALAVSSPMPEVVPVMAIRFVILYGFGYHLNARFLKHVRFPA